MIGDYPLITILSTLAIMVTVSISVTAIYYSSWGVFGDRGVKVAIWGFAISEFLIAVYRMMRITLGDDALALIPYWFFRDLAVMFLVLMIWRYSHKKR